MGEVLQFSAEATDPLAHDPVSLAQRDLAQYRIAAGADEIRVMNPDQYVTLLDDVTDMIASANSATPSMEKRVPTPREVRVDKTARAIEAAKGLK